MLVLPPLPWSDGDLTPEGNPSHRYNATAARWESVTRQILPTPNIPGTSPIADGAIWGLDRLVRDSGTLVESIDTDDLILRAQDGSNGNSIHVRASLLGAGIGGPVADQVQVRANVSDSVEFDVATGRTQLQVASTSGPYTISLVGLSSLRGESGSLTIDSSDDAHNPDFGPDARFTTGSPPSSLFEEGGRVVFNWKWVPLAGVVVYTLAESTVTPDPDDTPPPPDPDPDPDPDDPTGSTVTSQGSQFVPELSVTPTLNPGAGEVGYRLSAAYSHANASEFQTRRRLHGFTGGWSWDTPTTSTTRTWVGSYLADPTPDTLWDVQVRAQIGGTWYDWNTVTIAVDGSTVSAPPDPDPPPPDPGDPTTITSSIDFSTPTTPNFTNGRLLVRRRMGTFAGAAGGDWGSWRLPFGPVFRVNLQKTAAGMTNIQGPMNDAHNWYYSGGGNFFSEFASLNTGPFLSVTIHANFSPIKNSFDDGNGGNIASALDFGKIIRGDYNSQFHLLGSRIQNHSTSGSGGPTINDWQNRVILCWGHEHNGGWYKGYSGWDGSLVGNSELVNATNTQWPNGAGFLLRQLGGADGDPALAGNLGPLFRTAYEHGVEEIRSQCPGAIIDLTSAGASGAPGGGAGNMSTVPNVDWFPRPEYLDIIGYNPYGRGANRALYVGAGHGSAPNPTVFTSRQNQAAATNAALSNLDNWRFNGTNNTSGIQTALEWARGYANSIGRPMGFWECGTNWPLGNLTADQVVQVTNDWEGRSFYAWLIERFLPTTHMSRAVFWNSGEDSPPNTTPRLADTALSNTTHTRAYLSTVFQKG